MPGDQIVREDEDEWYLAIDKDDLESQQWQAAPTSSEWSSDWNEEQVEVRKVARPVEEIEITKSAAEDTRRVDETVRREEFDIDDDTQRRR